MPRRAPASRLNRRRSGEYANAYLFIMERGREDVYICGYPRLYAVQLSLADSISLCRACYGDLVKGGYSDRFDLV